MQFVSPLKYGFYGTPVFNHTGCCSGCCPCLSGATCCPQVKVNGQHLCKACYPYYAGLSTNRGMVKHYAKRVRKAVVRKLGLRHQCSTRCNRPQCQPPF